MTVHTSVGVKGKCTYLGHDIFIQNQSFMLVALAPRARTKTQVHQWSGYHSIELNINNDATKTVLS
jgi:hypothetical protein